MNGKAEDFLPTHLSPGQKTEHPTDWKTEDGKDTQA